MTERVGEIAEGPDILLAIRMYRKERELPFRDALNLAIEEYRRKGWRIPLSIENLYSPAAERSRP